MDLPLLTAFFLISELTLYVILDGFDLGVGILLLSQPSLQFRDHMVDSITPTWDGNETWIVMAGITLFAAFPIAYSILLPAFYLPLIIMLLALGFRGVSFEFRVQSKRLRPRWDIAFAIGSLIAAFMQGILLGGLLQGVKIEGERFAGSVLDVIRPLPIITGTTLVFGYVVLGAGWLKMKSSLSLQKFVNLTIRVSALLFAALFGIACLYAIETQPNIRGQWASHRLLLSCLGALFAVATVTLLARPAKDSPTRPFFLGLFLFILGISGILVIVFPHIVPFSLSLWDVASSSRSQQVVLIGATVVIPVVIGYSAFAYWVFRGRTPERGWGE